MNLNNFTIKSQDSVQKAKEIAESAGHQAIETGHLLKGVFLTDEYNSVHF
jgi:ATP-dependent Clp protease ATP-binding subunit ClpB